MGKHYQKPVKPNEKSELRFISFEVGAGQHF